MKQPVAVLSTLPRALISYASSKGANAVLLRHRAGLDDYDLTSLDVRVPRESVDTLWQLVSDDLLDPLIGIHLAECLPPGNAGILEYIAQSSATVGEAWAHIVRYWRLMNDDADVQIVSSANDVRLRLVPRTGGPFHPQWLEFTAAVMELSGRRMVDGPTGFTELRLPFARHEHSEVLEEILGCPVHHDHDAFELAGPANGMARPLVSSNGVVRDVLIARAEEMLASLPVSDDIVARAQGMVDSLVERGEVSLVTVAKAMHMSSRTLQRDLRARGTSFRDLITASHRWFATTRLTHPDANVADVAFLLGFSEVSAFHRAFRRWTGMTPGEYRKRALAPSLSRKFTSISRIHAREPERELALHDGVARGFGVKRVRALRGPVTRDAERFAKVA